MTTDRESDSFDPDSYWEKRLSAQYTLGSTGWISLGESFNKWMYAVRRRVIARFVRSCVPRPHEARVLDVGSGTGFYLDLWQQLGARDVSGCDLTMTAVQQLRQRFPHMTIEQADIGDDVLALPPSAFDAISVIDVMYHIVDDRRYAKAISNIAKLLKPGGTLVFTENFVPVEHDGGAHQMNRTGEAIRRMLSDGKLSVVQEQPLFHLMNTPVGSQSWMLSLWWRGLTRVVSRHEALGWALGATLFPIEVGLSFLASSAPSTRVIACRKSLIASE